MEVNRMEESGIEAVTDYVVSNGVASVTYAWCATHPQSYKAVICSSERQQLAENGQDIYCLPKFNATSNSCACKIRVDQRGIFLNDFTPSAPLWLALWQPQLLHRLFGNAVEVHVVDLDTLSLDALLKGWEGTEVKVRSITSKRRFTACVSQYSRTTGHLFSALSEVQEMQLLPSPCEDSSLVVAEFMPSLQHIIANACRVEYLKPLCGLHQLHEIHIAETQIRDRELHILAELPLLTALDISACSQLTSLDPLSCSPSLRVLQAANCERLVRMAQLNRVATLRSMDLSGNVLLPSEFASFLTGHPVRLQMGYFLHLRWPRDDPSDMRSVLSEATHLDLSYGTVPNIRWLCGAHNLEQLYLNHTNVTDADIKQLAPQVPFLRVLSLSYCDHLKTNLDFAHALLQLSIFNISRSSLLLSVSELEVFRRFFTVTLS